MLNIFNTFMIVCGSGMRFLKTIQFISDSFLNLNSKGYFFSENVPVSGMRCLSYAEC